MIKRVRKNEKGVALLITMLLLFLILILSMYFLSFSLTEKKISDSQAWGSRTYYLAEAGVHEMVWKLKNDATYKNNFETDPNWVESFTRNNPFGPDTGSYTVTIRNSSTAHGEIIASSTVGAGINNEAQRAIKTYVYRAMDSVLSLGDTVGYADGNITVSSGFVHFKGGSAYSDNNFLIKSWSWVDVDTDLNVVNNLNKQGLSVLNVGGDIYAANYPPAAVSIGMPAVDFDSADPSSYYSRADVVYTSNEFEDLIDASDTITLNDPITYVEGDVDIRKNKTLIINGLLVVERDFKAGKVPCWIVCCGGYSNVTVNHVEGQPSGIFAKRKLIFNKCAKDVYINGVLYAGDQMDINGNFDWFDVNGGILARKLDFSGTFAGKKINFDEETMTSALAVTELSPTITVEHWEEEY